MDPPDLLAAVLDDPASDAPRRRLAEALIATGTTPGVTRGEYLLAALPLADTENHCLHPYTRTSRYVTTLPPTPCAYCTALSRVRAYEASPAGHLARSGAWGTTSSSQVHRGFVRRLHFSPVKFLAHAEEALARFPVTTVQAGPLPVFERVRSTRGPFFRQQVTFVLAPDSGGWLVRVEGRPNGKHYAATPDKSAELRFRTRAEIGPQLVAWARECYARFRPTEPV